MRRDYEVVVFIKYYRNSDKNSDTRLLQSAEVVPYRRLTRMNFDHIGVFGCSDNQMDASGHLIMGVYDMTDPLIGQPYLVPQVISDMKGLHFIESSDRDSWIDLYHQVQPAIHGRAVSRADDRG